MQQEKILSSSPEEAFEFVAELATHLLDAATRAEALRCLTRCRDILAALPVDQTESALKFLRVQVMVKGRPECTSSVAL
jgi:hypothetical protein